MTSRCTARVPACLLFGFAVLLLISGCHEGGDAGSPGVARVSNPAPDPGAALLPATEELRIGRADGEDAEAFGRIRGLVLGPGGVYVLDGGAREVRAFDGGGAHLWTAGRAGGGPGEFQDPRGMTASPDGMLWIMDFASQRYTVRAADGELVATHPRRLPAFGAGWRGQFGADGALHEPTSVPDPNGNRAVLIRHEHDDGAPMPRDTFPLPSQPEANYVVRFGGGLLNLPVPFAARPEWAFDGRGGVWTGPGDGYVLARHALGGDTTLVLSMAIEPPRVERSERAEAVTELRRVLAQVGADPAQVDFSRIPDTKPVHGRLLVDDRGRLWVGRVDASNGAVFDVFSEAGGHMGTVHLDISATLPVAFRGDRLAGVNTDAVGVHRVVVYRLGF
jgi:hypothetical protein